MNKLRSIRSFKSEKEVSGKQDARTRCQKRKGKSNESTKVNIVPRLKQNTGETLLFNIEDYLRGRWYIRGLIGAGGYGEIYSALDVKATLDVAIKAENRIRRGMTSKRMILEQRILLRLQGKPHVPLIFASGHEEKINFIVMELLSINLGEIRKQAPFRRLSRGTVGRILMQAIAALREVHAIGYLHRDIKPANMCFGVTPSKRHILFLVDYGLVRRFRNSDGTLRKSRKKVGFRGTLRYVSIHVHNRVEQTPIDDLISLVYSGIELLLAELPWKVLTKQDDIRNAKEELLEQIGETDSYLSLTPEAFRLFCREILEWTSTDSQESVDYTFFQSLLTGFIGECFLSDPYDWENGYQDTLEPSTFSDNFSSVDK